MDISLIKPDPSDEEMAAIAAALDVLSKEAATSSQVARRVEGERWRFSGRWWNRPVPLRRDRPA